jgi:hypothetical protein
LGNPIRRQWQSRLKEKEKAKQELQQGREQWWHFQMERLFGRRKKRRNIRMIP